MQASDVAKLAVLARQLTDSKPRMLSSDDINLFSVACVEFARHYVTEYPGHLPDGRVPLSSVDVVKLRLCAASSTTAFADQLAPADFMSLRNAVLRKCVLLGLADKLQEQHRDGAEDAVCSTAAGATTGTNARLVDYVTAATGNGTKPLSELLRAMSGTANAQTVAASMRRIASGPAAQTHRQFLSSSSRRTLIAETRTSIAQRRPLKQARIVAEEVMPEQQLPVSVSEASSAAAALAADKPPASACLSKVPAVLGKADAELSRAAIIPRSMLAHRHAIRMVGDKLGAGTYGVVVVTAFPERTTFPAGKSFALAAKKSPLPPTPSTLRATFPVIGVAAPGGVLTTHAAVSALHRMAAGQLPVISVPHPREWPSVQCLLIEYQLLTELAHPNIVRCLSCIEDERGVPHMYLELCAGTLEALVREGLLTAVDRVRLAWHVVSAMAHVHDAGYLHYDLKMNNILVTMADGVWTAKVSDFGCARSVKKGNLRAAESDAGKFPEVAAALQIATAGSTAPNLHCITRASDVYIFGKRVLHELFKSTVFPRTPTGTLNPMMAARALCLDVNPSSRPQFGELRDLFYLYLQSASAAAL
jgi:hypothetical protein